MRLNTPQSGNHSTQISDESQTNHCTAESPEPTTKRGRLIPLTGMSTDGIGAEAGHTITRKSRTISFTRIRH